MEKIKKLAVGLNNLPKRPKEKKRGQRPQTSYVFLYFHSHFPNSFNFILKFFEKIRPMKSQGTLCLNFPLFEKVYFFHFDILIFILFQLFQTVIFWGGISFQSTNLAVRILIKSKRWGHSQTGNLLIFIEKWFYVCFFHHLFFHLIPQFLLTPNWNEMIFILNMKLKVSFIEIWKNFKI